MNIEKIIHDSTKPIIDAYRRNDPPDQIISQYISMQNLGYALATHPEWFLKKEANDVAKSGE